MGKKVVVTSGFLSVFFLCLVGLLMEGKRGGLQSIWGQKLSLGYRGEGREISLLKGAGEGWALATLGGYLVPLPQDHPRIFATWTSQERAFEVTYFAADGRDLLVLSFHRQKPFSLSRERWIDLFTRDLTPFLRDVLWWNRKSLEDKAQLVDLRSRLFPPGGRAIFFYPTQGLGLVSLERKREGVGKEVIFLRRQEGIDLFRVVFLSPDARALSIRSYILSHLALASPTPLESSGDFSRGGEGVSPPPRIRIEGQAPLNSGERRQRDVLFWD